MLPRVFQDCTDISVFKDFIAKLLLHYGRFQRAQVSVCDGQCVVPRRSVSRRRARCGSQACVPIALPAHPQPDRVLLAAQSGHEMRRQWQECEQSPNWDFGAFLEQCVDRAGCMGRIAKAYFVHAEVDMEDL